MSRCFYRRMDVVPVLRLQAAAQRATFRDSYIPPFDVDGSFAMARMTGEVVSFTSVTPQ